MNNKVEHKQLFNPPLLTEEEINIQITELANTIASQELTDGSCYLTKEQRNKFYWLIGLKHGELINTRTEYVYLFMGILIGFMLGVILIATKASMSFTLTSI